MAVLHNAGRLDTSNAVYRDHRVLQYDKFAPTERMDWIDYGLGGLTTAATDQVPAEETDVAVLYRDLAARGDLFGYPATQRFYEIGTPAALRETERFLTENPRG
jgi:hypothetical protein